MPENIPSVKDLHEQAAEAEENKDAALAIQLYKQIVAQDALNIPAYNSLMKLYRSGKDYKKELAIIDKAIKNYEAYYRKHQPKHNKKIDDISRKLNKAFGLTDKKGNAVYNPEPNGRWKNRKLVVEKRLDKA
jgi:tetratricopeptide (TPR) repeat protein